MPTNKDKLSLNIFICIYIYRIDPVIAIVFSIILWSSFLTGAKLLCKLSPPTHLFKDEVIFFFKIRLHVTCSCHTEEGNLQAGTQRSCLSSPPRDPAQQKISVKTKTLLNKTRVMYIHAGATIRRTIIIIRMRTRRRMFSI